jgi:hypothetical protein
MVIEMARNGVSMIVPNGGGLRDQLPSKLWSGGDSESDGGPMRKVVVMVGAHICKRTSVCQ